MKNILWVFLTSFVSLLSVTASAQSVRELRQLVTDELQAECAAGSKIIVGANAMSFADNGIATVLLSEFNCDWVNLNHPFCGARACTVRDYEHRNGAYQIVAERLE